MLVSGYLVVKPLINFDDNPALLIEVADTGIATLDKLSKLGRITAPLAGVKWTTNPTFLAEAHNLIEEAQRNYVAFGVFKDGTVKIWYESESGPTNLNEKLNVLSAKKAEARSATK